MSVLQFDFMAKTTDCLHRYSKQINHVKVFQGLAALFQRKREKPQTLNTIKMKTRPLFMLFCIQQSNYESNKLKQA